MESKAKRGNVYAMLRAGKPFQHTIGDNVALAVSASVRLPSLVALVECADPKNLISKLNYSEGRLITNASGANKVLISLVC